jgi:hypothetical protein
VSSGVVVPGGGPGAVSSGVVVPGGGPGAVSSGVVVPGGGPGAVSSGVVVPGGGPGAVSSGVVVPGGPAVAAPTAARISAHPGTPPLDQSPPPQAALLVPTALLTTGAAARNSTRGAAGPGTVSGLGSLLAASQLGALSGAIGGAAANRRTRGDNPSGHVTESGIAADGIKPVLVAGFSLGSDLNGPVLRQSAVPTLAIRSGSPTVTVTAFDTRSVVSGPALPGGDSGSLLSALTVSGGGPSGGPGMLTAPGAGTPAEVRAIAMNGTDGRLTLGGPAAADGAFGAGGEAGMAAEPMLMMPRMMGGRGQREERVRNAFLPEDQEYWGTEPGIPRESLTSAGRNDGEPDSQDDEYGPFEATGIGADCRTGRRRNTTSDGRMR